MNVVLPQKLQILPQHPCLHPTVFLLYCTNKRLRLLLLVVYTRRYLYPLHNRQDLVIVVQLVALQQNLPLYPTLIRRVILNLQSLIFRRRLHQLLMSRLLSHGQEQVRNVFFSLLRRPDRFPIHFRKVLILVDDHPF